MKVPSAALQSKLFQEVPIPQQNPGPATSTTSSLARCAGAPTDQASSTKTGKV